MAAIPTNHTLTLNREQIVQRLNRGAIDRRGISAVELLRQFREGTLDDPGEVADLLVLSDLLEEDDPIFHESILDRAIRQIRSARSASSIRNQVKVSFRQVTLASIQSE